MNEFILFVVLKVLVIVVEVLGVKVVWGYVWICDLVDIFRVDIYDVDINFIGM